MQRRDQIRMQQHLGLIYAIAAYIWWGIVPIYWKCIDHVPAYEIVTHRMVWSFVLVTLLILVMGQGKALIHCAVPGIVMTTDFPGGLKIGGQSSAKSNVQFLNPAANRE